MALQHLTDEQQAFVEAIRDFAQRECGTREQRDALTDGGRDPHNQPLYERIAVLGWLGVAIPEAYGGAGGGAVDMCLLCEGFARGLIPMGFFPVTMMAARPVELFGSAALKDEILGGLVRGRTGAIAMSEPEAGSDVGNLSCRADRANGGFVINGQKTWITGAHVADQIVVVCRTTRGEDKHYGLTMISVPRGIDGLEIRGIGTMGAREVNDMYFSDCFVPAERVVGAVDQAWMQLMAGLNNERLIIAAQSLGMAQRAFDDVLRYVKERRQFGRAIGSFQTIAHRLADLATEIEATRQLVYGVAEAVEANPGKMLPREASMAKLKATELAKRAALEGMQMMGGYGYATEYDMEGHVRHTLVTTIYGGTSEIQREIIARALGL
ncbi:MAG TPA: acyl-CoA dehydrogenase family protein [Solirubrobacteraceae bacterium]|nr:acyl-CoA dehydrogenase family protein [Solirubrobacteraceae bacterium]